MPIQTVGRLRIDASPADVGRRISVRYRADGLSRGHSEAVGVLDRWSGSGRSGILRLRRRDGTSIRIEAADLVAARVVPPEVSAYRLQAIAQEAWPARESQLLGDWELRWTNGVTRRANTVRVGGSPGRPLAEALAQVTAWYAERGGRPVLQLAAPSSADDHLDRLGWLERRRSQVMTTSVARLLVETEAAAERTDIEVGLVQQPAAGWFDLVPGYEGPAHDELDYVLRSGSPWFVSCTAADTGALLGIARFARSGIWAGVTTMETAQFARRRGVATAIMGAVARWGRDEGVERLYLQVYADSAPALALYDALGFTRHHDYVYRWPEGAEADGHAGAGPLPDR